MIKIVLLILCFCYLEAADISSYKKAYPEFVKKVENGKVYFFDNSFFEYDLNITNQNYEQLLNNNDLKLQLSQQYKKGRDYNITKNFDPGRIRYQPFFEKMYGKDKKEIEKNLVTIDWLPNSLKQKVQVTKINGVDKKLTLISKELENLDKKYLNCLNMNGGYMFRTIAKTSRASMHSFGIAVDIGLKCSHYWQWDKDYEHYKNSFPFEIVEVFEKYGFIWGGKWYHYDTMHFEYRPELILD